MSNSIPAYNLGYQETKYVTRNGTHSYVTLYIYTETYWLVVTLLNNGQGNKTSKIEAPKMKIEPTSRDLPYTVGENATFTVTTPIEEDSDRRRPPGSMSSGRSHVESRLIDLDTRTLVHHDVSRQMYDIVEERRYLDQVEVVYSVDTAQHNVSGILIVFASGTHVDELIADVTEGHTLTLHPTSQSGPFPPGFLSFDEPDGVVDPADENGDVVTFCSYDNPTCRIHCSVWGSDISRIELRKMYPSGRATPLDYWSYSVRQTRFKFFKRVDAYVPSSRGVSQRYQCVAWGSLGQSITRNYTLEPFLKARIVEGESSLVRDGDRMANLTCTVTGDPISNITFNLSYNFKYLQNQLPDQVYDHNGTTVAVKQIVYDDGDEYGSTAESTGVLYDAACSVTQNVLGREEFPNTETYYYPSP
ncbi:uncharacterized protein LOC101861706 [Aplysia californica]|uniref:Uncharacterized protein LOC101861706 n=1 Tax=Aplysia californica TaxID=6500 RepID=A0ABM0KA17_APLCA|nr:uncharacterized protein LOC101861706 [Aplysia californica]